MRFQPLRKSRGAVCAEEGFTKILAKSADVYARTVFTEHTWFFLAGLADSNQFHDMSLTNVQGAAIHGVGATGDKRGFVAAEEYRHGGHFLGLAHASDGLGV